MSSFTPIMEKTLFFCASFLLSYFLLNMLLISPLARFFSDNPDSRKMHHKPVPRIGGFAIIISFLLMIGVWFLAQVMYGFNPGLSVNVAEAILLSCIIIGLFGFFDDTSFVEVRVRHKISAEVILAFCAVYFLEIHTGPLSLAGVYVFPLWFSKIISFLWIIGVINAFNLIDGIDGLAGGISLISVLTLAVIAGLGGQQITVLLCLILAGSILGFLFHNMPPARTFMGDTGSLFLGTMMALISLHVARTVTGPRTVLIMPLVVGVPIVEVAVTMVRRYFKARDKKGSMLKALGSMVIPDNAHIHHRFMFRGFTHLETSVIICIIAFTLSCGGICLMYVPSAAVLPLLSYLAIPVILVLNRLGFGARFKKALGISNSRYHGLKKTSLIGVIDSDGHLSHLLERNKKEGLIFVYMSETELHELSVHLRAVIIRISQSSQHREILSRAEELAYSINGPVYIVKDGSNSMFMINEIQKNGTLKVREGQRSVKELIKELEIVSSRRKVKHGKAGKKEDELKQKSNSGKAA